MSQSLTRGYESISGKPLPQFPRPFCNLSPIATPSHSPRRTKCRRKSASRPQGQTPTAPGCPATEGDSLSPQAGDPGQICRDAKFCVPTTERPGKRPTKSASSANRPAHEVPPENQQKASRRFLPVWWMPAEGSEPEAVRPVRRVVRITSWRRQTGKKKGDEVNLVAKGCRRQFPAQNGEHPHLSYA
jgi:hypothetical protein